MEQNKVDLHIHSCNSDGELMPYKLLEMAQQKKLEYISITDHDNCLAYEELCNIDISKIYSGKLICGCELATNFENICIEILGYGVDYIEINNWYYDRFSQDKIEEKDRKLFGEAVDKITKLGLKLPKNIRLPDKLPYEGYFKLFLYENLKQYSENESFFIKNNINTYEEFQRNGLNKYESSIHISILETMPTIQEIVKLIHKSGGLAFLAHVYKYGIDNIDEFLNKLIKTVPIDGIECFYSTFNHKQINKIKDYCIKNNLYLSGGSDYHGKAKPNIQMGKGLGNLYIEVDEIEKWVNQVEVVNNVKNK